MLPKVSLSRRQLIIVGAIAVAVLALVFIIQMNLQSGGGVAAVKLVFWGTDSKRSLEGVFGAYKAFRPNVEIAYVELSRNDIREKLLAALAEGTGPDLVMIGNRDVDLLQPLLVPANATQFPITQFTAALPTVAEQDFVRDGKIYAVPLYIDTLALFYNKDMFDEAGITAPPKTWEEFQTLIPGLRRTAPDGRFSRAAAAIGGSEDSIDHATDILELLTLQNGTKMIDALQGRALFAREGKGLQALQFYLQFANAGSPLYTWNDSEERSLEAFAGGRTAMALGYHEDLSVVKQKSPFLTLGVAPAPQAYPERPVSFASYAGIAALKQGKNPQWAWDFMMFLSVNEKGVSSYLDAVKRPAGFRDTIAKQQNDAEFGVFAKQALTARSWQVPDDVKIKAILNAAIKNVLSGRLTSESALRQAEDQTTELLKK